MCADAGGLVAPDFGTTLHRGRVVHTISSRGDRPCVVYGPSGSGKSIATAQYASATCGRVFWVDAGGEGVAVKRVVETVLDAVGSTGLDSFGTALSEDVPLHDMLDKLVFALRGHSSVGGQCVVVDDLGRAGETATVRELGALGKALWRSGSRLIVTTRDLDRWPADLLREFALVGPEDLGLTLSESRELLGVLGIERLVIETETLHEACGGHLAYFTVLASQALANGLQANAACTVSLNAWLECAIDFELTSFEREVLLWATMLRTGNEHDLVSHGIRNATNAVRRISSVLPLFRLTEGCDSGYEFRVHDLVDSFFARRHAERRQCLSEDALDAAVCLLTERQDFVRAAELLVRGGDIRRVALWLNLNGEDALRAGHYTSLAKVMNALPMSALMSRPRLLILAAQLSAEMGNLEDALARSRAARLLAQHEDDNGIAREGLALSLVYLRRMNRIAEADKIAEEILASGHGDQDQSLRIQALVSLGYNKLVLGDTDTATDILTTAAHAAAELESGWIVRAAKHAFAIVPAVAFGDFRSTVRLLTPLVREKHDLLSSRVSTRGNVAVALLEMGRLDRCEALLRATIQDAETNGLDSFSAAYLPTLACVAAARGALSEGVSAARRAITIGIDSGDEPSVDQARVYLASILRAAGGLDESLVEAERAFEHLSVSDYMLFRWLAALEVAASLLALGDPSAARAWTESVATDGFQGNQYHALRADMILAEIDRRDGELDAAVVRLAAHRDYVLSENPNWQIAMYCRVFPQLLGMFALALGPKCLPAHMLRMILPEHAERILLESRSFLDDATWEQLGLRLLGESELRNLLARGGLPLCYVRLFGGLEVSIGGSSIGERDWKKRKARLLFTMLVVRRGHDIPRDQICEHLWPDMEEDRAVSNLYVVWSTMKTVLGGGADKNKPSAFVESVGGVCRIVRDRVRSDVDDFEESLQRAREAEVVGDAKAALRAYERIADIYRGDLLPGDCYDDWFANLREHYRTEFVDAMQRAAQLLASRDDPANALVFVRRAIQCDQYREDLYQSALRCQIAAGQRSSAIDTYLQCRDRLSDELGLDPSAETRALYSAILAMEARPQTPLVDPLAD